MAVFILKDEKYTKSNGYPTYWGANNRGYAWSIATAGLYTQTEAESIATASCGDVSMHNAADLVQEEIYNLEKQLDELHKRQDLIQFIEDCYGEKNQ